MLDYAALVEDYRSLRLLNADGTCFHAMRINIWREAAKALFSMDLLSLFPEQGITANWQPNEPTFSATLASIKQQCQDIIAQAFADPAFASKVLRRLYPEAKEVSNGIAQEHWISASYTAAAVTKQPWLPEEDRPYTAAIFLDQLKYLETFVQNLHAHPECTLRNDVYWTEPTRTEPEERSTH